MTAARFECFAVDHGVDNIAAAVAEFDGFIGSGQHGIQKPFPAATISIQTDM